MTADSTRRAAPRPSPTAQLDLDKLRAFLSSRLVTGYHSEVRIKITDGEVTIVREERSHLMQNL